MSRSEQQTSSRCLMELQKQLLRGKQVLLHGNVGDLFLYNGEYVSLRDFLDHYLPEQGYQLCVRYDIVDGIQFANPETMRPLFSQVRGGTPGRRREPPAQTPPTTTTAATNQGRSFSRRVVPPAVGGTGLGNTAVQTNAETSEPAFVNPEQAFPVLRSLLSQPQVPTTATIYYSDKLVCDAEHQSGEEPRQMVLLKKIVQEAALVDNGPMRNRRNGLILIAEHLAGIPVWFYKDNPLIELVHVGRPNRDERQVFFDTFHPDFHGGENLTPNDREKTAQEFVDLTEGLTAHDLHSIRRTSVLEQRSVTQPRQLVGFYKFGEQEDPWEHLNAERIQTAQATLESRVIGQESVIRAVVDMLITARVGLTLADSGKASKPKGVFFFVGPTGVGKTELAKAITALLFSDDSAFARFDMSEYAMEHAAEKLTGSPPGFVGYDEGGQLTRRMLERPFSLLLFDEIEKAHGKIMDKFLQILEDGRLTDSKGQTADFSQSVIIFTSNIGSHKLAELVASSGGLPTKDEVRELYLEEVRQHFSLSTNAGGLGRPELLNRLGDNILVFDVLRPEYIRGITQKFLDGLARSAEEKHNIRLEFPGDDVLKMIQGLMIGDSKNLSMGGRRIRTLLEERVLKELTRYLFEHPETKPGSTLRLVPAPDYTRIQVQT